MILLQTLGGAALILFGIRFLRKGLERLTSRGLHRWLERMTEKPGKALFAGFTFGAVAPSSTAQTLLALQLLQTGKVSGKGMLAFFLGAGVGITVTVQLISFNFLSYFPVFLVVGVIGFQFLKSEFVRGLGQVVLSLGFIFLAMQMIGEAGRALAGNRDFQEVMRIAGTHEGLLVVLAAATAFFLQSSTATIGMALSFAQAGAAGRDVLVAVVLGTNLGLAMTSLVAGWPTLSGRRLALANLIVKSAGIGICLAEFKPLMAILAATTGSAVRQAANLHTGFNLALALLGTAIAPVLWRLMERLAPPAKEGILEVEKPLASYRPSRENG